MPGHWASEHGHDRSLPLTVISTADPQSWEAGTDAAGKKNQF